MAASARAFHTYAASVCACAAMAASASFTARLYSSILYAAPALLASSIPVAAASSPPGAPSRALVSPPPVSCNAVAAALKSATLCRPRQAKHGAELPLF